MTPIALAALGRPALSLLPRFWPAIPILGLAIALHFTRVTLADRTATLNAERLTWTAEIARADKARADAETRWAHQSSDALSTYASALADRQPLIVRSTDTVREYAQSDAGRVLCRSADRVRAIDELDASLAQSTPAGAAGRSGQTVHLDPAASPAGR